MGLVGNCSQIWTEKAMCTLLKPVFVSKKYLITLPQQVSSDSHLVLEVLIFWWGSKITLVFDMGFGLWRKIDERVLMGRVK